MESQNPKKTVQNLKSLYCQAFGKAVEA